MTTYVAFLRAINLGATRKFPKDALARATQAAGFTDVATHINTGNVRIGTSMRARARIETALEQAYLDDRGFEVSTIVLSQAELSQVARDADEIGAGYDGTYYVSLLKHEPDTAGAETLEARSTAGSRVVVRGRAAHLLVEDPYHSARLTNVTVEKHLGVATNRNLTVVRALVAKWC